MYESDAMMSYVGRQLVLHTLHQSIHEIHDVNFRNLLPCRSSLQLSSAKVVIPHYTSYGAIIVNTTFCFVNN